MTQEERITKLMDMLDHSEAYSEQDIRDFIGSDAEVQEIYRTIIETRQSFRKAKADNQSIGTDEAWQRFEQEHLKADKTRAIRLYPRARGGSSAIVGRTVVCRHRSHTIQERGKEGTNGNARHDKAATKGNLHHWHR